MILKDDELADLESALSIQDAADYKLWIDNGMALAELGQTGFALWDSWSQSAANYHPKACLDHWKTFSPTMTGYKAIFKRAWQMGWRPSASPNQGASKPTKRPPPRDAGPTQPALALATPKRSNTRAQALWTKAQPINWQDPNHCVMRYLTERGLGAIQHDPPANLRFLPMLDYYHKGEKYSAYPAMIARVDDATNELCAVHVTYLTEHGEKAPVPAAKKVFGPLPPGSAIRLYGHGENLAICEGIETALALRVGADLWCNVWSAISAVGMARFAPPEKVRNLSIYADKDANQAGEMAAKALAEKIGKNAKARIFLPTTQQCLNAFKARGEIGKSVDFLDVLSREGRL